MGHRVRVLLGLWTLAEIVVLVLLAAEIGVGWTLVAALATAALGCALLARQGARALAELRRRARGPLPSGRALGDSGLIAAGAVLLVLPGFLGDVVGLLCLLPPTRFLIRRLLARAVSSRLPPGLRGPVRVRSARGAPYRGAPPGSGSHASGLGRPRVIEGDVVRSEPAREDRG